MRGDNWCVKKKARVATDVLRGMNTNYLLVGISPIPRGALGTW